MNFDKVLTTPVKDLSLPDLPYKYNALEPAISQKIMELHHDKHHATYLNKLKEGLSGKEEENKTLKELFSNLNSLPADVAKIVKNHGGGYYNHCLFWNIMSSQKNTAPSEELTNLITLAFGSLEDFKQKFSTAAAGVFGSGWAWLIKKADGNLMITQTANQNNPLMATENEQGTPLLGIDVWEHAYYLDYTTDRAKYIENWWSVVDWDKVSN